MKKRRVLPLLLIALVIGLGGGFWYWWTALRFIESTDDAYVVGDITHISAKLPGYALKVAVRDNQEVAAGDLLVKLEDHDVQARLDIAAARVREREAAIAVIDRQIAQAEAATAQVSAEVRWVGAEQARVEQDYKRDKQLMDQNLIPSTRFENAAAERKKIDATATRNRAALDEAQRNREVQQANRLQVLAAIESAKAEYELAKLDLGYTELRAPIDGVIGNRTVQEGEYVRPGITLLSVVPIHSVWIEANFKETQIGTMRAGQKVTIEVDAYPDLEIEGRIESLSPASGARFSLLPPENATGNFTKVVQRVPVRIGLPADVLAQKVLRPGLSVVVTADRRDAEQETTAATTASGASDAVVAQ